MNVPLTEQEPRWQLCLACGEVTCEEWTYFVRAEDTGELVPAPEGTEDPITRCPACGWDHVDDDSNPGILDGPRLIDERDRLLPEYADLWIDRWIEVAKERQACLVSAQEALRQAVIALEEVHEGLFISSEREGMSRDTYSVVATFAKTAALAGSAALRGVSSNTRNTCTTSHSAHADGTAAA